MSKITDQIELNKPNLSIYLTLKISHQDQDQVPYHQV